MRKVIVALALALSLAGCATGGSLPSLDAITTAVKIGTTSVANPVTPERLYQVEATVLILFKALNTWKKACVAGTIPESCKAQIRTVQIYTMQFPPYLRELRAFVKNNDQVNAAVVYNQLTNIIAVAKSKATGNLGG